MTMNLEPSEPEVIIFERSPFGNLDAIVEHDGRCVYFYLNGQDNFGTRACWVANLGQGPLVINQEEMQQGLPPMMPRIHCSHPTGREVPLDSDLAVVWFEEGNGVALVEKGQIIAIIPPWSGSEGFHGYARDCIAESPVAWPMPTKSNSIERRVKHALDFWQSLEHGNPFGDLQVSLVEIMTKRFGAEQKYWAIDGGQFPPRGMIQMEKEGVTTFSTVGMSLVPQPNVEMFVDNPSEFRRIELAIQVPTKNIDEPWIEELGLRLSGLARTPWQSHTWFAHRHSCDFAIKSSPDHPFALFWNSGERLSQFRDDPVNLLWLVPITQAELDELKDPEKSLIDSPTFQERIPV